MPDVSSAVVHDHAADAAHERFMALALAQAQLAWDRGEVPVGAIVVKDGEVIATGFNQPISVISRT